MTDIEDRVRSIFLDALDRAPEQWPALLDEACGGDAGLRSRVSQLLDAHQAIGSIHAAAADAPTANGGGTTADESGSAIGPYKLVEVIGEGGMGTVYLAQQQAPVRRLVAVKVIKAGMDTRQVVARFEAERQALALMDHPNIARVLDGGLTPDARPYFVMELVKGVPITQYCDDQRLTPKDRLGLFVQVCQAVQHAHQKGVIHRDLKPNNVLVAPYDGRPVVKVIDFGVAKAAGQPLTEKTLVTGLGAVVGTPEYMSPEQAELNNADVDTRSDVYSLGVLLYELLTGSTPLTRKRVKDEALLEVLRVIREEDPPRPSVRLSTLGAAAETVAETRRTDPRQLTRLLRGELDWIVMRCLEKDRARRYETADALAKDVGRYLADEPVHACPPSAGYRVRKFVRRNRAALVTATVLFTGVLAVAGSVGWAARDRAARRAEADLEKVSRQAALGRDGNLALEELDALQRRQRYREALTVAKAAESKLSVDGGPDELLSRVRQRRAELQMHMRLESVRLARLSGGASDRYAVGQRRADLDYRRAFRDYGIDVEAVTPEVVADRVRGWTTRVEMAAALEDWASLRTPNRAHLLAVARAVDPDPWRRQVRDAMEQEDLPALKRLAGSDQFITLPVPTLVALGNALGDKGAYEDAAAFLEKAQRQHPGEFWINHQLGDCFMLMGTPNFDQAIRYYTAALALRPDDSYTRSGLAAALSRKGLHGQAAAVVSSIVERDPNHWMHWYDRGLVYTRARKWDLAIADYSKAIDLKPDHADSWFGRAVGYARLGKWAQAVPDYSRAIELKPTYSTWWYERGLAFIELRQWTEAVADFSKAVELQEDSGWAWRMRGFAHAQLGNWGAAVADYSRAIELGVTGGDACWLYGSRALASARAGRFSDAQADYEKVLELAPDKPASSNDLAWLLVTWGEEPLPTPGRALQLAKKAVELAPQVGYYWNTLGAAHYRAGDWKAAVTALQKARELRFGASSNCYFLAMAHWRLEDKTQARKWYDEAIRMDKKIASTDDLRRLRVEAAALLGITSPNPEGAARTSSPPKPR